MHNTIARFHRCVCCNAVALSVLLAGCTGDSARRRSPEADVAPDAPIVHVVLQTSVVALSWDRDPEPDGVMARIYLWPYAEKATPVLRPGKLEFEIFDGPATDQQPPMWKQAFDERAIRPFASRDNYGLLGYNLKLDWGNAVPKHSFVTVAVRYLPVNGPPISSQDREVPIGSR